MNIPRYILPASFAAVFHAALLFGFPGKSARDLVRVTEVILADPAPKPEDDIVPPPEKKSDSTEPVKPLVGGPTPPEIDPLPDVTKLDNLFTQEDLRPRNPSKDVKMIPKFPGRDELGEPGLPEGNGLEIALSSQLDNDPRAKVQPSPDYPARMRQDGVSGSVTVEFAVNTEGNVVRAEAVKYTHREFVEPALRAVRHWRFEPGRRHGRVVPFRMTVPIEFGIDNN